MSNRIAAALAAVFALPATAVLAQTKQYLSAQLRCHLLLGAQCQRSTRGSLHLPDPTYA